MPISRPDFTFVTSLVRDHASIVLEEGKEYLVESRLIPLARRFGHASIDALIDILRKDRSPALLKAVVDAMTTNETSFFRDPAIYAALRQQILPQLLELRGPEKKLGIWCAAASSGQEPYSLAMLLRDAFPAVASSWKLQILATDISAEMLERCREARYTQLEVNRGLPAPMLVKYFSKQGLEWVLKDDVKQMVEFRPLNLATGWGSWPSFDLILLRNVLIYFDLPTKKAILARARTHLRESGYLLLGAAETTLNVDDSYERVAFDRATCYRPRAKATV